MADEGTVGDAVPASGWMGVLLKIASLLVGLWNLLPQNQKDKVINTVVDGFTGLLESFFDKVKAAATSDASDTTDITTEAGVVSE